MAEDPPIKDELVVDVEEAHEEEEEEEEEGDGEEVEGWDDWESDEDDSEPSSLCLFCDSRFDSADSLFDHCNSDHSFDFHAMRKDLGLDFYGCFKLINYIRSQVAEKRCWSCGLAFQCKKDLLYHLHATASFEKDGKFVWEDDIYLKPFMRDDILLHSFANDEDEDGDTITVDKDNFIRELMNSEYMAELCIDNQDILDITSSEVDVNYENGKKMVHKEKTIDHVGKSMTDGISVEEDIGAASQKQKDKKLRVSFANVAAREIKNVNENYFGSYGSFGIHREMISDKVRMDSYRGAILNNPILMNQATVMDVGCGTGILSLFAAQAGASRVIAVEASAKMAAMATQIAKDNGLFAEGSQSCGEQQHSGVITVVHSMVEDLDKLMQVSTHSIDVLVSEWMGYCLLYESMLSSVLYARDHWLKPGGAILPDTAAMFVAGFGRGGTSLPFWENVYGFDMSCIGKEVLEDAAQVPIVDVVDSHDILTESALLQSFDLTTMKPDEMDFTAGVELKLKTDPPGNTTGVKSQISWCHGIVLWFEVGFTSRFCKEVPTVLSTSPYGPRTHWSQTIFTFQEPIAMALATSIADSAAAVGTEGCPATRIKSRISIARSAMHRSIDISVETTGISLDGRKHSWPAQLFSL